MENQREFDLTFLSPLRSIKKLGAFSTMDLEAENWTNVKLVGFYDGINFKQFPNISDFLDYFLKTQNRVPCYIHYLSYDGMFILQELIKRHIPFNIIYKARIICIKIKIGNNKYEFRDSFSLFFSSLKQLSKDFDVEHKKLDARNFSEQFLNPEYNKFDTIGLYEILQKFFKIVDYEVGLTLASTSLKYFRKRYLKVDIARNHSIINLQRNSYYGARNEIYNFNLDMDKRFYYYDINSLYPYSMLNTEYPVGVLKKEKENIEDEGFSLARVKEYSEFPILPLKTTKLYFINGRKFGYYTNLELRYAQEKGAKIEVYNSFTTNKSANIFKEFVTDLYERRLIARKDNNQALALTLKLLMNSLYGKFGQAEEVRKIYFEDYQTELLGASPLNELGSAFQKFEQKEFAHSIPLIAAYVTSKARTVLHENLEKAEFESIFYSDTDSIITDKKQFENSSEIGKFKLEDEITKLLLFLPKFYIFESEKAVKIKSKGINTKEGEDEYSREEKMKSAIDFITTDKFEMKRGIKGLMVSLREQENVDELVKTKTVVKTFKSEYDKRKINSDYSTEPFENDIHGNPLYKKLKMEMVNKFKREYVKK